MPRLTHGERRSGSIQDLAKLLSLDDTPGKVLLVSDRTLYLLANLAMDEVRQYSAYAISYGDADLYFAVEYEDSEATDVDEIANNFGLEVIPVDNIRPIYSLAGALTSASSTVADATITTLPLSTLDAIPTELLTYESGVFTVVRSGRMLLNARATWQGNATGLRQLYVYINGAFVAYSLDLPGHTTPWTQEINIGPYLNAGQTIEFKVRQTSGGNLLLLGAAPPAYYTSISIVGF